MFPIIIKISPRMLQEFILCEYGAHEDGQRTDNAGTATAEYGFSAVDVLSRHHARIEIRNAAEADLIYYAACSGTFGITGQGAHPLDDARRNRSANRIADILRPHAKAETVRRWRRADGF